MNLPEGARYVYEDQPVAGGWCTGVMFDNATPIGTVTLEQVKQVMRPMPEPDLPEPDLPEPAHDGSQMVVVATGDARYSFWWICDSWRMNGIGDGRLVRHRSRRAIANAFPGRKMFVIDVPEEAR